MLTKKNWSHEYSVRDDFIFNYMLIDDIILTKTEGDSRAIIIIVKCTGTHKT